MKFTKALKYIILFLQLLIFGCECKNFDAINKVIESFSSDEDPNKKEIITSFNTSSTAPPPVAIMMQGNQKSPAPPPKTKTACMDFQDDRINHGELVVFVDSVNGKSDNSGESWEKAVNSINIALARVVRNRAENLSKGNAIQPAFIAVAAGTYTHEHENKISSLGDGKEMIALYGYTDPILSNLIIAGGFLSGDKCSEVDKNKQYNANERKTIIDAQNNASVLAIAEKGLTNIDIRDFTFINGAAKEVNVIAAKKDGGAISLRGEDLDNITFRNINIENSTAENNGGAVAITGAGIGNVVFNGLSINNSTATQNGGGFYASSGDIELNSIKITDNKSKNGGGLYIMANASITVAGKNNSISENKISETNGAGIYINSDKNHSFDKLAVFKNTSENPANKAKLVGAGVYLESNDPAIPIVIFTNSTINDHKAQDGAGIYAVNTKIKLDGVILKNNIATKNGGGIYSLANIDIGSFTCEENNAKDGGCLYVRIIDLPSLANRQRNAVNMRVFNKNIASNFGGAIYALSAVRGLHDAAFIGNQSINGGAIYANGNSMGVNLKNALFRKNTASSYGGAIYFAKNSQISTEIMLQDSKENLEPSLAKTSILNSTQILDGTNDMGQLIPYTKESFSLVRKAIVSLFDNNTANFAGGAIYANEDLYILNSSNNININKNYSKNSLTYYVVHSYNFPITFDGNNSQYGGAIYATNFEQSGYGEYNNNTAILDGGAILAENINNKLNGVYKNNSAKNGAAIFADNLNSNINILEASNNTATNKGGALYFNNLTNSYAVDGKFTANKANIASVFYFDNSNSNQLSITGTYTENSSSESPILVINNHKNMSLQITGSFSKNNPECLKHSDIAEFVDDLNAVTISGNFNGNEAITRSTAGGAFKFVNVVNLSISGRSNNYKTTENGGFLDVDKVTDLTLNNINYSSNKSNKNGGAISIQEIKNQAIIKNILGKYNEASENGGYLYIGKTANLNVENDEKTISNYTQKVFLTAYGLPIYSKYVEELDLLSESQKQLSYNKMLEYLGPVLKDFSNDASWYEDIIEDLRSEERTFIEIKERVKQLIKNSLRAAAIEQLRSIIHKDVTKNFDSLTNIEQDTLVNKFIKEPLKKLEDTAKNMSNFLAQERNFMTYYALSFIDYKRQDIFGYSYSSSSDFDSFFIQNNKAKNGGFIYVHEVENNALFTELLLRQNTALENGGSVYIHKIGADLAIKESNIENNNAKSGGAFYVGEIVANLFVNNTRTPISDNPYNTPYFDWSNYDQLKASNSLSFSSVHVPITKPTVINPSTFVPSTVLINNNNATNGGFAYIGKIGGNLNFTDAVLLNSSIVIYTLDGNVNQNLNDYYDYNKNIQIKNFNTNLILTTDAAKTSGVVINNKPALNINAVVIKP